MTTFILLPYGDLGRSAQDVVIEATRAAILDLVLTDEIPHEQAVRIARRRYSALTDEAIERGILESYGSLRDVMDDLASVEDPLVLAKLDPGPTPDIETLHF